MKSAFALGASLTAAALVFALVPACSSSKTTNTAPGTTPPGPAACDDTKCGELNKCLTGSGETKCRRPCAANTDCPAGATCVTATATSDTTGCTKVAVTDATPDFCAPLAPKGGVKLAPYTCGDAAPKGCVAGPFVGQWCCDDLPAETYVQPFCVKNLKEFKEGPKQWGASCLATGGLENNPDCDTAQGFYCYGTSPADGASYCTRYGCTSDRECAPGMYCGTINVAPNVTTAKPTRGETTTACIKRDYCAPCNADFDCPSSQFCVLDANGAGICTTPCKTTENCPKDAKCVDAGIASKVCYPRAGVCAGDGSLCSPCRSDADCGEDGACVQGQYTTERSCAKKSTIPCKTGSTPGTDFQCPTSGKPGATIRCRGDAFEQVPENYCHGLYGFGESADVGCWTPSAL